MTTATSAVEELLVDIQKFLPSTSRDLIPGGEVQDLLLDLFRDVTELRSLLEN